LDFLHKKTTNIVKTISANSKSTISKLRVLKKYLSHDTIPLKELEILLSLGSTSLRTVALDRSKVAACAARVGPGPDLGAARQAVVAAHLAARPAARQPAQLPVDRLQQRVRLAAARVSARESKTF
jgi:hypothetical protein